MPVCEAVSKCNSRVSRQATKNVTRGHMRSPWHSAVGAASLNISVDFRVVLTVAPMCDR